MKMVWRDLLFNLLGSLVVIMVLILVLINDPKENETKDDEIRDRIVVDMYWGPPVGDEAHRMADVDLWVQGPADAFPVGYSNKTGTQFALLRDVLSARTTLSPVNQEQSGAQFVVPGRYTVNVHLYRIAESSIPIPVQVVVSVDGNTIYTNTVTLLFHGQEITAVNFTLDEEGVLSDVGHYQRPLRSAR